MANLTLFEKLDQIESRYDEMTAQLSSPEVHARLRRATRSLRRRTRKWADIVAKYREWKEIEKGLAGRQAAFCRSRRSPK